MFFVLTLQATYSTRFLFLVYCSTADNASRRDNEQQIHDQTSAMVLFLVKAGKRRLDLASHFIYLPTFLVSYTTLQSI